MHFASELCRTQNQTPSPELSGLYERHRKHWERQGLKKSGPDGTLKLSGAALPSFPTDPSALLPPYPPWEREIQPFLLHPNPKTPQQRPGPASGVQICPALRRPQPQQVQAPPRPTPGACCAFFPECELQRQSPNFGAGTGDRTGSLIRSRGSASGAVAQVGRREQRVWDLGDVPQQGNAAGKGAAAGQSLQSISTGLRFGGAGIKEERAPS